MSEKTPLKAWILLFTLSLIWGSSFILIKRGLVGLSSMEVGALRIFSAGLVMLPMAIGRIKLLPQKDLKYLFVIAMAGSFIPSFLFAIAQTQMPSALVGVLNAITPIFTILISVIVYKQRKDKRVWIGVLVGFVGTAILITNGSFKSLSAINSYSLLIIAATIFYAINGNVIKFHLSHLPAVTIASVTLVFGGVLSGLYLVFFSEFFNRVFASSETLHASYYIILLGILGTAVALIIFNRLVQVTDPVFTSSVTYIIPIIAILWGVWDGEVLSNLHFIGIALILIGVYITNKLGSKTQ
ncbi:MAG: DMT family transporter [Cyclobacteriaceae bacterium]